MIDIRFEDSRSAAYDDGKFIGECCFSVEKNTWTLFHTEVDPSYGGQGIAKRLLKSVVENAASQGAKIKPVCSYVVKEFQRYPEEYEPVLSSD